MKRQNGFSIVEGLLVVVVLVIIGAVGYLAYANLLAPKTAQTDTSTASVQPVKVQDTKDLDTVSAQLDQLNVEDTSNGSQLDSAASSFN